jgi:Co/Zn/Cd efflux system component
MQEPHPHVPHPRLLLVERRAGVSRFSAAVGRAMSSALGSMALFWVAFLVPLITLPAPDTVKLIVSIIFSSWFQAWALPVLQRAANAAEQQRAAKADADHLALTSLHHKVDQLLRVYAVRQRGDRSP